jgi:hypothetical protein
MKKVLLIGISAILLSACNQGSPKVDQSKMCIYSTDEQAKECESGELSWFKPSRWGSEQLPLNVAGAYCDFNYPIMSNNSGVICVFTDKRMRLVN